MITLFETFLNNSDFLYHCTNYNSLKSILSDNKLYGTPTGDPILYTSVSTTRNKNYIYDFNPIQIVLNKSKLSKDYKTKPFEYWKHKEYEKPDLNNPHITNEEEELILTPDGYINNILNYITKINIITDYSNTNEIDTIQNLCDDYTIPFNFISSKNTYTYHPDLIKNKEGNWTLKSK